MKVCICLFIIPPEFMFSSSGSHSNNTRDTQEHLLFQHYEWQLYTRPPGQEQFWLFFIRRTKRLGYAGTITNRQIVLNTQKSPFSNQATPKKYLPNFPTQKLLDSKISNPIKSFDHPRDLKAGVPPEFCTCVEACLKELFCSILLGKKSDFPGSKIVNNSHRYDTSNPTCKEWTAKPQPQTSESCRICGKDMDQ